MYRVVGDYDSDYGFGFGYDSESESDSEYDFLFGITFFLPTIWTNGFTLYVIHRYINTTPVNLTFANSRNTISAMIFHGIPFLRIRLSKWGVFFFALGRLMFSVAI